jgi:hypothetical protein
MSETHQTPPAASAEGEAPVKAPAKAVQPAKRPPLPTIADLVKDGADVGQAHADLVNSMALRCGKSKEEAHTLAQAVFEAFSVKPVAKAQEVNPHGEPFYRVLATSPKGSYWKIGRMFTSKPVEILKSALTPEQCKVLEGADSSVLSVTLIK